MMGGIQAQLAQVVQLSCLTGLYADTGIGVRGTVVRFVARILRSLVPAPGRWSWSFAHFLFLPFIALSSFKIGTDATLSLIRPVALALAVGHFFVHGAYSTYFFQMLFQIFFEDFKLQCIHARIGLYRCGIYCLGMTGNHPFFHTYSRHW